MSIAISARVAPKGAALPFAQEERRRALRLDVALTRGVLDNLKSNHLMMPVFAAAICLLFSPSVNNIGTLALWFALVVASLAPLMAVTRFMPTGILHAQEARKWQALASVATLMQTMAWASMAWLLWVPGHDFNHLLIQLVLAVTLTAHAATVGPSRAIAIPSILCYGIVMTLAPMQAADTVFHYLGLISPLYVGYAALLAYQNHKRAKAALMVVEERNALLAELVCAKLESDQGREKAEAASLAKSQFLANMSHELRTPLNAIIGFSELISTRIFSAEPERNYEYSKMIHDSGLHLLALINDILDLAKIEAGRWEMEETPLDMSRLAADALQLVSWKAEGGGVTLVNTIASDQPFLLADERAMKQVLINLLSNAVKFTPSGGTVTVFGELDAFGGFEFGVADTGVGIAEEDQKKVFDSFGQGKHDIAIADKGTGLGLCIVRGLCEAHGGTVTLDSDVGKGTRVTLTIPASRVRPRSTLEAKVA